MKYHVGRLFSAAGMALLVGACADATGPVQGEIDVAPGFAVGEDITSTLQYSFGTGVETAVVGGVLRDTRIEVSADGGPFVPAFVLIPGNPRWIEPIGGTEWIGPNENASNFFSEPVQNDTYRTTFDIPANATAPVLNIRLWADNAATVYVNGVEIGSQMQIDAYENYGCISTVGAMTCDIGWVDEPWAFTTAGEPIPWNIGGSNTLQIVVLNAEFIQGCEQVPDSPGCQSASGLNFEADIRFDVQVAVQGCTPGYWRNHTGNWVGYSTGQQLGSVFTGLLPQIASQTLYAGITFGGGPAILGAQQILMRAAVAALLNAANPGVDYPMTSAEIVTAVNTALATNNRNAILALADTLDGYNNAGCPLGR